MCRWKIIAALNLVLATFSISSVAAVSFSKNDFDAKLQLVQQKISSKASLVEKIDYIKTIDKEYVAHVDEMREQSKIDPTVLLSPVYIYAWDLYDQMIPLVRLQMNAQNTALNQKICLETISLVENSNLPGLYDESLDDDAPPAKNQERDAQNAKTLRLIKKLCQARN